MECLFKAGCVADTLLCPLKSVTSIVRKQTGTWMPSELLAALALVWRRRFPCASYTLSTSAASSSSWSTSFIHGSHRSSMSFASPLCHKLGCRCRSWITLPPYFLQTQHQDEKLHFNTAQPTE